MNAAPAKPMSKESEQERYLVYRIRMLPDQLERAYRRVEQLEREATRYKMQHLLRRTRNAID
jgi:hypothetical protein